MSSASAPARRAGRPVLVLVGPPGAGKTSVGRRAAERLGVDFRDTDTDVEEVAGKPVRDIFLDEGEEHFRALEREAVTRALREHTGVLALGGGAVLAPALRDALRGHTVVFLSIGLADAVERVGLATARPVLMLNPRATLKTLLDVRRPLYEQVASATVGTDGRAVDDVVTDVLRVLDR